MKSSYAVVIALALCSILAMYDYQKAYAQVAVTIHTPTGGALGATSDCTGIARSTTVVWIGCNGVLYAINSSTDVMIDSESTLPFTLDQLDTYYGRPSGTSVLIADATNDSIYKFDLIANVVTHTGTFNNSGCSLNAELNYDASGFLWGVCPSEDKIIKINPSTMITTALSQDLTDGVGIECDAPVRAYYAPTDNIGVIRCGTSLNVVSFSISGSTVTLLDSEAPAGNIGLMMDELRNVVFMVESNQITRWTYTDVTGLLTLTTTTTVNSDACTPEYSTGTSGTDGNKFFVCIDDSGTNTVISAFTSTSSAVTQILNQLVTGYDASQQLGIDITSGTFAEWLVSSNLNNQRYILIEGLRETDPEDPEPPSGGTGNGTNQIGGVCGNTDVNGDGRVNVIDCVGNTSAWTGFTSGVPAVQVVGTITDGLGFTDCAEDGSDQDTCGSGLFMFILALLIVEFLVLAGYLGLTSKLNADRETVDVLLIMLIAGFAVLSIAFYLNWIPDLVFYSIIAIIAGFLTFGLIAKIRGK